MGLCSRMNLWCNRDEQREVVMTDEQFEKLMKKLDEKAEIGATFMDPHILLNYFNGFD